MLAPKRSLSRYLTILIPQPLDGQRHHPADFLPALLPPAYRFGRYVKLRRQAALGSLGCLAPFPQLISCHFV